MRQNGVYYETVKNNISISDIYIDFTDDDIQNIHDTYDFLKRNDLLSNELDDLSVTYDDSYVKKAKG